MVRWRIWWIPPPPPYRDALRGYGCVPLTHCERAAPLSATGNCGICPNEAAVGSEAIVSATAKAAPAGQEGFP